MRAACLAVAVLWAVSAAAERPAATPTVGRAVDLAVEFSAGDVSVHFSFPVRVPSWYLWQRATDCKSYLRHVPEVKRCEPFLDGGKPAVLLAGEVLGRPYALVVGLSRKYRRGHGTLAFRARDVSPRGAEGVLGVERGDDGQSRIRFRARVPRDPAVPEIAIRLGLLSAVHGMAAKVQSELEADFRALRGRRAPADVRLERAHPRP